MPITDCSSELSKYHSEKVTLQKSQQDEMRSRRNNGRTRLNNGLEQDDHPKPALIHSQGSYAMRTMVQDPQNDYDIDDGVYFDKDDLVDVNGVELTPYAARERVCNALQNDQRLKTPAEIHKNCVRQEYPEGYHIDMPVYRIVKFKGDDGNDAEKFELASGDSWEENDARAVTKWFNNLVGELNAGESDGSQMRRITKLTKQLARSRIDWKEKTCSGIVISKLVVECFVHKANRDDEALYETLKAIKTRLVTSQRIEHPVLDGKVLAEEGDAKVRFFRDCLYEVLDDLAVLEKADCTKSDALKAWDKAFNTSFFGEQITEEDKAEKAEARAPLFKVTSNQPPKRDDDNRRFG